MPCDYASSALTVPPDEAPAPAPRPTPPASGILRSARRRGRAARVLSLAAQGACSLAAAAALAILILILGYMVIKGIAHLNWSFFTNLPLDTPMGMRNSIVGTLILVGLASAIGVPVGMLCGIYLAEYAHRGWASNWVRTVLDVLAGTPTILFGLLVYVVLVVNTRPLSQAALGHAAGGAGTVGWFSALMNTVGHWESVVQQWCGIPKHYSGWAGAVALSFIMLPIVARATEEMLRLVPIFHREASMGMGASKTETLFRVILPTAMPGVITGILLAIARVAGETAPLFFTSFGNTALTYSPTQQMDALPERIYFYSQSNNPQMTAQSWTAALVLVTLVFVFSASVRFATRKRTVKMHR